MMQGIAVCGSRSQSCGGTPNIPSIEFKSPPSPGAKINSHKNAVIESEITTGAKKHTLNILLPTPGRFTKSASNRASPICKGTTPTTKVIVFFIACPK